VFPDEIGKRRLGQSESSHIIRSVALDVFRMAQEVAGGQAFPLVPPLPGGARIVPHPGHFRTLGLTERLAFQLGRFAFMSLILLSFPMGVRPSPGIIQFRAQDWENGMAMGNSERLIPKVWSSRGVLVVTWGWQDCHRSALPVRMSCSRSILASTLSRRPPREVDA
jgi:hypothetical protein